MLTLLLALGLQAPPSLDSVFAAAAREGFHGSVLVARNGQIELQRGIGLANRESGTPFGPATLVQIGSNVKDITKVAIYQLVEAGRLSLDDSLPRFFADVPADKRGIRVRHLMNHSAGIPANVSGGDNNPLSRDELLRRVFTAPLAWAPGEREMYSNAGYSVLAAIVERLSGEGFDAYAARRILDPLGLRDVGSHLRRFDRARLAHGYAGGRDVGVVLDQPHFDDGHQYQLRGNGGYVATLQDMWRFYRALRGDALLRNAEHRRDVFDGDVRQALAGSDNTSFFMIANFPAERLEVIVASNNREYQGNRLLRAMLPALGVQQRPNAAAPAPMAGIPDSGMGRTVRAYLDAYATGDTAVMRRFFTEHAGGEGAPPMETRLQRYLQMRGNLGNLTVRGMRQAPGGEGIVVLATAANGEELTMTFVLDAQPPHRLRGIRVEAGN